MNTSNYRHLVSNSKNIHLRWYNNSTQVKSTEKWMSTQRRMKLVLFLLPCTYVKNNWIKKVNLKSGALKLLEKTQKITFEVQERVFIICLSNASPTMNPNCLYGIQLHRHISSDQPLIINVSLCCGMLMIMGWGMEIIHAKRKSRRCEVIFTTFRQ